MQVQCDGMLPLLFWHLCVKCLLAMRLESCGHLIVLNRVFRLGISRVAQSWASVAIQRATFSAMSKVGALVLPLGMVGMAEASTTRSPPTRPPRPF